MLETHGELNFSLPQHCFEYCNTLGWFWDTFEHPQRLKLLYLAAAYLNQERLAPAADRRPAAAAHREAPTAPALDAERMAAARRGGDSRSMRPRRVGWTQAYLESGHDTRAAGAALAMACSRLGNDPHNQEIALCLLEDYGKNRSPDRDRLLLAAAQHTARHRKYGDPLDCSRRFGQALGIAALH